MHRLIQSSALISLILVATSTHAEDRTDFKNHPVNKWIKHTPTADSPASPRLGYEGACVWDRRHKLMIRYGGHNQGGGGEQGAEVWTFNPLNARWTLKLPNTSPPGVCCNAQNLYDLGTGKYIRFPFFSGSHGWQWWREIYLNDSSVWTYDLASNRWRNMRPLPTPRLAPYRCASWDSHRQVAVVFAGEGSREGTSIYDPRRNEWTRPKPKKEPPPRSGGNMAYDAARKLHVLFGAQFTNDPHTWTYDIAKNVWRDMQPKTMPPTNKNDAVLTYDPINRVVLAIVKQTTGKGKTTKHTVQTWAYDAGKNTWTRMQPKSEPDNAGNRTRNLIFAPELNLAILENCTGKPREQQVWTYRYAVPKGSLEIQTPPLRKEPPLVEDVVVSVLAKDKVEITWPATKSKIAGYHVERALVEVWSNDQLKRIKNNTPPLAKPSVGALNRIGKFERLTKTPIKQTTFTDTGIDLTKPQKIAGKPLYERRLHKSHLDMTGKPYGFAVYAYRVRTVDAADKLGGPSPAVFTISASPQHVFSREEGMTCRLKWKPNAEKNIKGYRVYRMNGRFSKAPLPRLTADPISATKYTDKTAGKPSRRYYIVAVDALGQEGFPSSPVWYRRIWARFYKPFVGDWHQ